VALLRIGATASRQHRGDRVIGVIDDLVDHRIIYGSPDFIGWLLGDRGAARRAWAGASIGRNGVGRVAGTIEDLTGYRIAR
jgi:hypothetical protein